MHEIDKDALCDHIFMILAQQTDLPKETEAKIRKLSNLYCTVHDQIFMAEIAMEESFRTAHLPKSQQTVVPEQRR